MSRQAIVTKYLPATNTRGSRIKAFCDRGSITIPYPHAHEGGYDSAHRIAAEALCARFADEDEKQEKYATPRAENPWLRPMICGGMPDASNYGYVFVFAE